SIAVTSLEYKEEVMKKRLIDSQAVLGNGSITANILAMLNRPILYTDVPCLAENSPWDRRWFSPSGRVFLENDNPAELPIWEWTQVNDPLEESETQATLAGVSGTAINPRLSSEDMPLTHPFSQ